nr:amino acid ABC transporter substrate-binding protein [Chloroflexota bacterium]
MKRNAYITMGALTAVALVLVACGGAATTVEVEVTRVVEVTSAAPAATSQVQVQVQVVTPGERMQTIKDRGNLICGVHGTFQGFGYVEADGSYTGFDVEFCKAWAAAIFGDATKVEYRSLTAKERFTALQTGEVDVLSRNSTWTLTRDVDLALTFGPTTFYDGQAMMVRKDLPATEETTLKDLEGANICVQTGTTTELNLTDQMKAAGAEYTPVVFEDNDAAFAAYDEGRCDAITSDRSQLATLRVAKMKNPDDHVILSVVMSKEPLAPAVLQGDDRLADVVHWTVYGMIQAEELGITSQNVDSFLTSADPVVKRLLGVEGEMGAKLGLSNDFIYQVIKQVGNYGEAYDRNLGPDTPYQLARGQNDLWTNGGLMYAPPIR